MGVLLAGLGAVEIMRFELAVEIVGMEIKARRFVVCTKNKELIKFLFLI